MTLVLVLLATLLLGPGFASAFQTQLDSDTFGGSNGTVLHTYNANWINYDAAALNDGVIRGTPGLGIAGGGSADYRAGIVWSANQWASLTMDGTTVVSGAFGRFLACVRLQTATIFSGYCGGTFSADVGNTGYRLARYDTRTRTNLATSATTAALSDVVNVEIVGTVLTLRVNGTTLLSYDTVSDATKYASGSPGLRIHYSDNTIRLAGAWLAGSAVTTRPSAQRKPPQARGR